MGVNNGGGLASALRVALPLLALMRRLVLVMVAAAALPGAASAVDPARAITQYGHRVWRVGDAGLDHEPLSLAQTTDGVLWVGTTNGLSRFDGKQFLRWQRVSWAPVAAGFVGHLLAARNGDLFAGSLVGLSRVSHNEYYTYRGSLNEAGPFTEDSAGRVWLAHLGDRREARICSIGRTRLHCYSPNAGYHCSGGESIAAGGGELWVGGPFGICRWSPGRQSRIYSLGGAGASVTQIIYGADHSLWASVRSGSPETGLWHFEAGTWKRFRVPGFDSTRLDIWSLLEDRRGSLWIGTLAHGVYRLSGGRVEHFDHLDGLSSDSVSYIFEDKEGSIWISTARGLDQLFDLPITRFTAREGLRDGLHVISPAPDGSVFVAGMKSIERVARNGQTSLVTTYAEAGTPNNLLADSRGRIWVGTTTKLLLFDRRRPRRVTDVTGSSSKTIWALAEDKLHHVWTVGTDIAAPYTSRLWRNDPGGRDQKIKSPAKTGPGFYRIASDLAGGLWVLVWKQGFFHYDGSSFKRIPSLDAETRKIGEQIVPVAPGEAWVTSLRGAAWLKDGRTRVLNADGGLPCDEAVGAALDASGDLWLTMQCDLVEVPASELARWQRQPGYRVQVVAFGPAQGYSGDEGSDLVRSANGALWFTGGSEVYEIDPGHIPVNSLPPLVQIQGLTADQRDFTAIHQAVLPELTRNVEIDYVALSYIQPDLLKFRYRLFGHEREWTDAGNRRQAFYNDLPPGSYRFQVTACNKDGVCNQRGASITLVIPPAWWQTWWFRTLCVAIMLGLIAAAARWRLNAYAKSMRIRFDDRLEERTRVARDLHDTLMQTVLASKLLAEGGQMINTVPEGRAVLTRLSQWLGSAADEGRAAVKSLRSSVVETNHLAGAFEVAALEGWTDREPKTHISVTGELRELHPIVRDEIHRIGVEAIRNARAHSGASHIRVAIDYDHSLTLRIRDDGHGMDDDVLRVGKAGHFGLPGMRERAEHIGAKLTVSSSATGTELSLVVPGKAVFVGRPGPVRSFVQFWLRRFERPAQASAEVGS